MTPTPHTWFRRPGRKRRGHGPEIDRDPVTRCVKIDAEWPYTAPVWVTPAEIEAGKSDKPDKPMNPPPQMTTAEAVEIVRRHNRWRRGDEALEMERPKQIGEALDLLCDRVEAAQQLLAAERALADRLADQLDGVAGLVHFPLDALDAWKEARANS